LKQAGYRVGLYTSPHLSDFRERIRILEKPETNTRPYRTLAKRIAKCASSGAVGRCALVHGNQKPDQDFEGMISEKELVEAVRELKPVIEKYNKNSKYGPLSFFEVYTALAFVYFKKKKVDFAVLETGLGGRLDATNAACAITCALTPISLEHTDKLGHTLREIATEKAGIVKERKDNTRPYRTLAKRIAKCAPSGAIGRCAPVRKLLVISAQQEKEAMEVIRERCSELGAKLYEVGKDIFYEVTRQGFHVMGLFQEYPHLELRLMGRHQMMNAAVAIGVIESLRYHGIFLGPEMIREGLVNSVWPGRCEVVSREPLTVLDGAQNAASAKALKQTIQENLRFKKIFLVLGISQDKDIEGVCRQFYDWADEVIVTKANNPRATSPRILSEYFSGKTVHVTDNVKEAKRISQGLAKNGDLILVTGSLFVVGEFRNVGL
jgi:dihydrofolate synthase/folylpolyglutamate synthase